MSDECGAVDASSNLYYNTNSDENFEDLNMQKADVLGAHFDKPWIDEVGQAEMPVVAKKRSATPWPHELEGVRIPMPDPKTLHVMQTEFYQRAQGQDLGPATKRWRDSVFAWAKKLRSRLFGDTKQVTGLWALAKDRFRTRLQVLDDKELVERVMGEISNGVRMPFEKVPRKPIIAAHNHLDLPLREKEVFEALIQQLEEKSIEPFVVGQGNRPSGVYSLRWVPKSNPEVVRLTLNGRPINLFFPNAECTIELETHKELRTQYRQGQMYVGFDLHNGFFNQQYHASDRRWVCFRIHEQELAPAHVVFFKKTVSYLLGERLHLFQLQRPCDGLRPFMPTTVSGKSGCAAVMEAL